MIAPCGDKARSAINSLSAGSFDRLPPWHDFDLLHGWSLFTAFKNEGDLERHLQGLFQFISSVSRGKEKVRSLSIGEMGAIVMSCGLNPQYMSAERRAAAAKTMSEDRRPKAARKRNMKGGTTAVALLAQKTKAKKNLAKPYGCKSPPNKTITMSNTKHRYNDVKSPCNCRWTEAEILKTVEEGYRAKQSNRALRWLKTEEHGVVLLHYARLTGETTTLCGVIYNRSTDQYVRKEDFEAKKKE